MAKTKRKSNRTKKRASPKADRLSRSQKIAVKRRIKRSRPAHKRILLNPLTILFILCTLVFLATWTYKAIADTTISAEIYAQPLTEGAVITSPIDGATFPDQVPIMVSGTCPDSSYVKVYANGVFRGISLCGTDHTFQIQISLFSGSDTLLAQDFNVTDQAGPVTPSISVTLLAPSSVSVPAQSAGAENANGGGSIATNSATPLLLTSDFHWQTFASGSKFSWKMDLDGGYPPYSVKIDWGDGSTSNYKFDSDPIFSIYHTYAKPGYYSIKAYSTDSKGNQRILQLAALITAPGINTNFFGHPTIAAISNPQSDGLTGFFLSSKNWLWIAWPSLIIVALMMFSFWLGELQDRRVLLAKKKSSRSYSSRAPLH